MERIQFENYAAAGYNRIPLFRTVDLNVSLQALTLLLHKPNRALLQFNTANHHTVSILGLSATQTILYQNREILIKEGKKVKKRFAIDTIPPVNPLDWLSDYHSAFKSPRIAELPDFAGGMFGYLGNAMNEFTAIHAQEMPSDALPDFAFMLCDDFLVIDHNLEKAWLVCYVDPLITKAFDKTEKKIIDLADMINQELQQNKTKKATHLSMYYDEEQLDAIMALIAQHNFDLLTLPMNLTISGSSAINLFATTLMQCGLPGYFLHFDDFSLFGFGKNSLKKFHQDLYIKYLPETFPPFYLDDKNVQFSKEQLEHDIKPICLSHAISPHGHHLHAEMLPTYSAINAIKASMPYPLQIGTKTAHAIAVSQLLTHKPFHATQGLFGMFNWHHDFIGQFSLFSFCEYQNQLTLTMPLFCKKNADKKALEKQLATAIESLKL